LATAEQTSSLGARVSRIEGGYEHLATKADLAQVKAELKSEIAELRGDIRGIKWWIISIGAAAVALSSLAELLPLGG
jgi:hypothetical protein